MAAEKAILTKYAKLCTSSKCCEHSQLNRLNATSTTTATTTAAAAAVLMTTTTRTDATAEQSLVNGENNSVEQINITEHSTATTTAEQATEATLTESVAEVDVTENGNTIPDAVNKLFINY